MDVEWTDGRSSKAGDPVLGSEARIRGEFWPLLFTWRCLSVQKLDSTAWAVATFVPKRTKAKTRANGRHKEDVSTPEV